MKKALVLSVAILLYAGVVFGQAGAIGLYVDTPAYAQCDFIDAAPALVAIFAVHKFCPGATGSQWMVVSGGGFACSYVGEIPPMGAAGSSQTGISISYGGCVPCDVLLVTINYYCTGTSPPCAYLEVVADPSRPTGDIIAVGCDFVQYPAPGARLYINPDGSCSPCGIATRETNWGKVKALYQ